MFVYSGVQEVSAPKIDVPRQAIIQTFEAIKSKNVHIHTTRLSLLFCDSREVQRNKPETTRTFVSIHFADGSLHCGLYGL